MKAKLSFFPVGNGDMTLIETEKGNKILIDMNIRSVEGCFDDENPDVISMLRKKLDKDPKTQQLFVDVLLISHPDEDHCRGLSKYFHLGPPDELASSEDKKILIREIWSSPIVFRSASRKHNLCADAKAFNCEARRRVRKFRDNPVTIGDGDRILILGEDEDGKTDGLGDILVLVDQKFSKVNGQRDDSISVRLLAPLPIDDEDDEDVLSKNNSSTILQISLSGDEIDDKCRFLTGGDAEVVIWEKLWNYHSVRRSWGRLSYDILQAPHHCSWHSLSHDSWSEMGEDAKVSKSALYALSQARSGADIVASSNPIKDDDNDPPSIRAKREYNKIVKDVKGSFICVGEYPSKKHPDILEFEIGNFGARKIAVLMAAPSVLGSGAIGRQPIAHG